METYIIHTLISSKGTIDVSTLPDLFGKEVRLVIQIEKQDKAVDLQDSFTRKWAGYFKTTAVVKDNPQEDRIDYLAKKYQ